MRVCIHGSDLGCSQCLQVLFPGPIFRLHVALLHSRNGIMLGSTELYVDAVFLVYARSYSLCIQGHSNSLQTLALLVFGGRRCICASSH